MNEKLLRMLLRTQAVVLLCALPAVLMPTEWMDGIHRGLGMGPLPRAPLTEYLTRSLSLVYAAWGLQLAVLASDMRRFLPMVRLFGWLETIGAGAFVLLDTWVGMPLAWTLTEGLMLLVLGTGVLVLERRVRTEPVQ